MIEIVESEDQLEALRGEWESVSAPHPFLEYRWLKNWWDVFHCEHSLYTLVGRDIDGKAEFIAPWYMYNSKGRGREIRFLGSGRVSSDYMSVMCRSEDRQAKVEQLAEFLLGEYENWDCMRFEGVAANDPFMNELAQALELGGASTKRIPQPNSWRLELPATWDEYLASCQKKIRQKLRKVERESGELLKLEFCQSGEKHAEFFDQLVKLHIVRRSEMGDSGCFDAAGFREFLRDATRDFLKSDQLWLGTLKLGDLPAASCLGFEQNQVLYYYQTGRNLDFKKQQPGWLLNSQLIREAIERGITAIDYLRGDEEYKQRLGAQPIPQVRLQVVSPKAMSRLRNQIWDAGASIKQMLPG